MQVLHQSVNSPGHASIAVHSQQASERPAYLTVDCQNWWGPASVTLAALASMTLMQDVHESHHNAAAAPEHSIQQIMCSMQGPATSVAQRPVLLIRPPQLLKHIRSSTYNLFEKDTNKQQFLWLMKGCMYNIKCHTWSDSMYMCMRGLRKRLEHLLQSWNLMGVVSMLNLEDWQLTYTLAGLPLHIFVLLHITFKNVAAANLTIGIAQQSCTAVLLWPVTTHIYSISCAHISACIMSMLRS